MTIVFGAVTQIFETELMAIQHFKPNNSINLSRNNMLAIVGVGIMVAIIVFQYKEFKKSEDQ